MESSSPADDCLSGSSSSGSEYNPDDPNHEGQSDDDCDRHSVVSHGSAGKSVGKVLGNCTGTSHPIVSAELKASSTIKYPDETKRKALDAAVDVIINKKERPANVRLKFKLSVDELDEALLKKGAGAIVKHSRRRRRTRKPELAVHFGKAVDDVIVKGMSVRASAKLHRMNKSTLNKELIDRGFQPPTVRRKAHLESAVQEVLEKNSTVKAAAKIHNVSHIRISKQLKERGYVYKSLGHGGTWVNMSENPDDDEELTDSSIEVTTMTTKQEGEKKTLDEESLHVTQVAVHGEEIYAKGSPPMPEVTAESERIVDVRVQRQYLVKWQGETKEEATWVDEDIFLGLVNNLNIA